MFKCKFVTIFQLNSVTQRKFCHKKFRLFHNVKLYLGFPGGSVVKNPPAMQNTWVRSLGLEDPLKKEMATHSSILAQEILWTEEPGGLQSMGSQKSDTT